MSGSETVRVAARELAKEFDPNAVIECRDVQIGKLKERLDVLSTLQSFMSTSSPEANHLIRQLHKLFAAGQHEGAAQWNKPAEERKPDRQEIRESIAEHNWEMATGR